MDTEGDGDDRLRPYPAPGRPEQPQPGPSSPWPWIIGGLVVAAITFGGLLFFAMYAIGTSAG